MNKVQLMIVGNTRQETNRITGKINTHNTWRCTEVSGVKNAIAVLQQGGYDAVILSDTLEEMQRRKISKMIALQREDILLMTTTGQEDLYRQLKQSMHQREQDRKPSFSFTDDIFKHIPSSLS